MRAAAVRTLPDLPRIQDRRFELSRSGSYPPFDVVLNVLTVPQVEIEDRLGGVVE
jgi:hypothetical protein